MHAAKMAIQIPGQRVVSTKFDSVSRICVKSETVFPEYWLLLRKALRFFILVSECARLVLTRLNIRLVERIDADDRTGNGSRHLPAKEFLAYVPDVLHADMRNRMASPLQCRHRLALQCILLSLKLKVGKETVVAIALGCCHRLVCQR